MSNTTPPPPAFPPPAPQPRRNRTNAIIIGTAAALIAGIVTTGVIVANSRDDSDRSSTTAEAVETTLADDTITADAEPEPTPENTEPEIMGLTDGIAYEDGVEVTLSGYKRGTSSAWAAPESTPYVSFTVKIVNKSETVVDLGTGFVMCYYGDESKEAEQVFDSERGLEGLPSMRLRAGRTASAKVGCEMPKGEEYLQIELAPSMESEVAIFAGNVN